MTSRDRRQAAIQELLSRGDASTQRALVSALLERGIAATQVTVSRDLKELGAVKGPAGYVLAGEMVVETDHDRLGEALRAFVLGVECGGTLVVMKTGPGRAQPVAVELDSAPPEGVLGSIAGDDTIFVSAISEGRALELRDELRDRASLLVPEGAL